MVRRVAVRTPDGLVINPGVLTSQMNGDDHEVNTGRIIAECSWKLIKRHPKLAYPFVWSSSTSGNKADWLIENQKGKQVYVSCKSNAEIIGSLYPKWAFDVCCWFPFHPDKNCILVVKTPNLELKGPFTNWLKSQAAPNTTVLLIEDLRSWLIRELKAV